MQGATMETILFDVPQPKEPGQVQKRRNVHKCKLFLKWHLHCRHFLRRCGQFCPQNYSICARPVTKVAKQIKSTVVIHWLYDHHCCDSATNLRQFKCLLKEQSFIFSSFACIHLKFSDRFYFNVKTLRFSQNVTNCYLEPDFERVRTKVDEGPVVVFLLVMFSIKLNIYN
jgi:hypothetical protein